jgi:hypothetical protein
MRSLFPDTTPSRAWAPPYLCEFEREPHGVLRFADCPGCDPFDRSDERHSWWSGRLSIRGESRVWVAAFPPYPGMADWSYAARVLHALTGAPCVYSGGRQSKLLVVPPFWGVMRRSNVLGLLLSTRGVAPERAWQNMAGELYTVEAIRAARRAHRVETCDSCARCTGRNGGDFGGLRLCRKCLWRVEDAIKAQAKASRAGRGEGMRLARLTAACKAALDGKTNEALLLLAIAEKAEGERDAGRTHEAGA